MNPVAGLKIERALICSISVLVTNAFRDEGIKDELTYMVKKQRHDSEGELALEIVLKEDEGDRQGFLAGGKGDGNLSRALQAEPAAGNQAGAHGSQVQAHAGKCGRQERTGLHFRITVMNLETHFGGGLENDGQHQK